MIKKGSVVLAKRIVSVIPLLSLVGKIFIAVVVVVSVYNLLLMGRIFPNVFIAGEDVSFLTTKEASKFLKGKINFPKKLTILGNGQKFEIDLDDIGVDYNLDYSAYNAYNIFRTGNLPQDFGNRISALWVKRNIGLNAKYDSNKLEETISVLAGQIAVEPVYPTLTYQSGQIVINKGQKGQKLMTNDLRLMIVNSINQARSEPIKVVTQDDDPSLTDSEEQVLHDRAQSLIGKKLNLNFEFQTFNYGEKELFPLLEPKGGYKTEAVKDLISALSKSVERPPQNPLFVFEEGKVKEFAPAKTGVIIDQEKTYQAIIDKLVQIEATEDKITSAEIVVKETNPDTKTEDVNNLGIKELIGRGTSKFAGSIPSRVYNVNLAATRLNGVLVAPGETFSFNDRLGDVSKLTGYKEAYVIKDGKTVLGDGGGVCQVSTTLFRSVMNAGLPVIERRAHAYRVGYYEQDAGPGLDATVYSPTTDFKFKNDTANHILIQTIPDTKNLTLVFELYGTKDGRVSTVTKPVTTNIVAPPEDSYVDDPTLPAGKIKQIEHKAWGATSTFDYKVEKDGQVIFQKKFISNYRPWQAVYLRGTGPAI